MKTKAEILAAMRADKIPIGTRGMWSVRLMRCRPEDQERIRQQGEPVPPVGYYRALWRTTTCTAHTNGELVMNDVPSELRKHLGFALRAEGRVLITGLGLGCVLRGVMLNPRVTSIDVVEREKDVIRLVRGHLPGDRRLQVHHNDALRFIRKNRHLTWDCAWHDLWSDPDMEEPHLQITHQKLMVSLRKRVRIQGAWAFPRWHRRALRNLVQGLI